MLERPIGITRDFISRYFPEREFFYRRGGEVTFVRFGTPAQLGLAVVALALGAWVVYAGVNLMIAERIAASKEQRIVEMASAYRALGDELESAQQRFLSITEELEAKHEQLVGLIDQRQELQTRLGQVTTELDQVVAERDRFMDLERALGERISRLEGKLHGTVGRSPASGDGERQPLLGGVAKVEKGLESLIAERDSARHLGEMMSDRSAQLQDELAQFDGVEAELEGLTQERDQAREEGLMMGRRVVELERRLVQLDGVEARFTSLLGERDLAVRKGREMTHRIEQLEGRLTLLKSSQQELVAQIQERTETSLGEIEAMIALTGINVEDLLEQVPEPETGLGGPFVGLSDGAAGDGESAAPGGGFGTSVVRLERHLNRWAGLQSVLQRLPMASPLDSYYVASKYGKRRDPFSKKWAMHHGADLAGSLKSPVWSTAPGTVTFAGRNGPYGKLVAIDHGFGLVTRYGHLRKILVKKGDKVDFRHKIGIMGSTGRSTGSHVHYEVLFEGKSQDPAKFMKAGKYVFKG
jgi:murein DD-endopeptidase MepM/ murein hydrolase activator NlpD